MDRNNNDIAHIGRPGRSGASPKMHMKIDILNLELFKTLCDSFSLAFRMLDAKQQDEILKSQPGIALVQAAGLKLDVKKNGGIGD